MDNQVTTLPPLQAFSSHVLAQANSMFAKPIQVISTSRPECVYVNGQKLHGDTQVDVVELDPTSPEQGFIRYSEVEVCNNCGEIV